MKTLKIILILFLFSFSGKAQTKEILFSHLDSIIGSEVKYHVNRFKLIKSDPIINFMYPTKVVIEIAEILLKKKDYRDSYDAKRAIYTFLIHKSYSLNNSLEDKQSYVSYLLSLYKYGNYLANEGVSSALILGGKEFYNEEAKNQIRHILQTKEWGNVIKIAMKLDLIDQKNRLIVLRDSLINIKNNDQKPPQYFALVNIALARWGNKKSINLLIDDLHRNYRNYKYISIGVCRPEIIDVLLEISKEGHISAPPPAEVNWTLECSENYNILEAMKIFIKNFPADKDVSKFACTHSNEEEAYFKYYLIG